MNPEKLGQRTMFAEEIFAMHCPRCGSLATANQQFCRSCGLNLEKVAALIGDSNAVSETTGDEIARLKELKRKRESWGGIAGMIAFGLALILFIILIVSQMILRGGGLAVLGSILILLAAAAGTMAYLLASAKSLEQKLATPPLPQRDGEPLAIKDSIGPPKLPPVSVTEQTTKLLSEEDDRSTHEIAN